MSKNKERAEELFTLLADGDMTSAEVTDATEWSYAQFMKTVQVLRDMLATNGDVISVTAEPNGHREPWLYSLKGGDQIVNEETSRWVPNRVEDAERRLKTIKHVMAAAVVGSDGRSTIGRKARIYHLHLKRAEEEIAMLADGQVE